MSELVEPKAGESTFELWKVVAQLVRDVSALKKMQITPATLGKVTYADGNVSIDFDVEKCQ